MSRTIKRFLSILLTAALVLSLGISGWAIDDITIVDPEKPVRERDEHVTDGFDGGTELELEEIDPSTLNVPRLGEVTGEDHDLDSEELPFGLNDIVRVSIVLEAPSTMSAGYSVQNIARNGSAIAYRESLKQQQAEVEAKISAAGVSMNVKWNMTLLVNIISAEVRYCDIETIESVPGVREVWLENKYEPQADEVNTAVTTEYMVGAADLWAEGYTGAGSRVAIIDTGTDQDHISFDPEALEYALEEDGGDYDLLTWDTIRPLVGQLNVSVDENVYKNAKIPYAYNYVDGGYVTDHMSDSQGEHGSHVSGIAAANRYIKQGDKFVDAVQAVGAVGVAPDAQIITMKVFGAGGGAYDSDYMVAIEDAIVLGADSVNLSLGSGSPGFSFSNGYQNVMDDLVGSGTVVTMSAGNSGFWFDTPYTSSMYPYMYTEDAGFHTGGSPGSFVNSFAIASADNIGSYLVPLFFNGHTEDPVSYNETNYSNEPIKTMPGTFEYVLLDGPGIVPLTDADDDTGETAIGTENDAFYLLGSEILRGKVAICYRGESSFYVKAKAAVAQGAIAVIIINNRDGVINMNLEGYDGTAPCVSILKAVGDAAKAESEEHTDANGIVYYTGTVTVADEAQALLTADRDTASMSSFSAWGVPGSLILKPEMVAPGGSIYSVWGANTGDDSPTDSHEDYELMSGTSMAAPHATGMAALVAQYIRENDLVNKTGMDQRALINSLLMSTATPMFDANGEFVPVMQQGAGLGDAHLATQAKSYITMNEDATASWADGKVKVELGQDAAREGEYQFSFNINNFSDVEMSYDLNTYIFTQDIAGNTGYGIVQDRATIELNEFMEWGFGAALDGYEVSYAYPTALPNLHDVDKDGDTDADDAQAILDYITGAYEAGQAESPYYGDLDLEAGEMDGVDGLSSYDAQLLLEWLDETAPGLIVAPGESVTVTVTITLSDYAAILLDYFFANGTYIQGFTYVTPTTETEDGEILGVEHSIPILGFYGSWTDPSMFDAVSPVEEAYGSPKLSYIGVDAGSTNYLTVNTGHGNSVFMGNPYAVEDEFPAERLAISPMTKLVDVKYNLIRNAATTGWAAFDGDYNVLNSNLGGSRIGAFYYVNGASWMNIATQTEKIGVSVSSLGVKEDDELTVGYFAVPEYYGLLLHPGTSQTAVSAEEIGQLLADGELGHGAYIGYTFTVDATAPTAEAKLNDDGTKITVTAQDNNYVAYIAIMDVSGNVVFAGEVPEQSDPGEEVEITFDVSDMELPNGVAIFVGDYAENESAYLIIFDPDQPVTATKTVYMLTDTLEAGKNYIISDSRAAGKASVLASAGAQAYTTVASVNIVSDENGVYIPVEDTDATFIWESVEAEGEVGFINSDDGGGLSYAQPNYPYVNWADAQYVDGFIYEDDLMLYAAYPSYGMEFYGAYVYFSSTPAPVYIYTETTIEVEMDPSQVSSVTVTPPAATLILDVVPTIELVATVEPIVATDRTVTWSSSDEDVATVDQNGLVTAVAPGTAIITATSNMTPEVYGEAKINVTAGESVDAVVYGQVAFGNDDIEYGAIDLNDMSVTDFSDNAMFSAFTGGGVSGEFVYGVDSDYDFHRYNWNEDFAYDEDFYFSMVATYAPIDIAAHPTYTIEDDGATYEYPYIYTGFNSSSYFMFCKEDGYLTYFDLSDLGNFVACTFCGISQDDDGSLTLYYLILADDGMLYLLSIFPNYSSGSARLSGDIDELGYIGVLTIGEDHTAYSISTYESDEAWYLFIADNSIQSIYYVDLEEMFQAGDPEAVYDAHYVGRIEGATNLSSLTDFYYDTISDLGTITIGEDGGSIGDLPMARTELRTMVSIGTRVESVDVELPTLDHETIKIDGDEGEEDVEIVEIIGGLDSVGSAARKPVVELDSAVFLNPDDFVEDERVEIGITTPGFDPEASETSDKEYYNGFVTITYDPEVLTFVGFEAHPLIDIYSVYADEENGVIKFAYASLSPVEEGVIAVALFTVPEENTEVTVTTSEANDDLDVDETTVIPIIVGYSITIEDYTKGGATTSIDPDSLYLGEVTFTVDAEIAVAVIVKDGPFLENNAVDFDEDNYRYTTVDCVDDEDGNHSFTITVTEDTTICLVYKGDVSLNGKVETKDGTMIKRYAVGLDASNFYNLDDPLKRLVADVDGNGKVETKDGTMVARQVVGTWEIAW